MRSRVAAAMLLAACYSPTVATGVPCSDQRDCPRGQVCGMNDHCGPPGRDGGDVPSDATSLTAWSKPQLLPELSSMAHDTDPSISGDGLDIIFASDRPGGAGSTELYRASRMSITQPFGPPILLAEINTALADQAAELSSDGLTIYLRRQGATSLDIFTARRATRTSPFETIVYEPQLSSAVDDTNPAISRDGLTFSVTREAGPGDRELYIFERPNTGAMWSPARQLSELTTKGVESGSAFAQDGLAIVFQSDRDSMLPDINDLYIATRATTASQFGPSAQLTTLATPMNESDPSVTADLRYMVFECESDLCFATR